MERIERIIQPDARNLSRLLARPDIDSGSVKKSVAAILKRIEEAGDAALVSYTREFDCAKSDRIIVPRTEVEQSASLISAELKQAIDRAKGNIERFHRAQKPVDEKVETEPGVYCWRKSVPLQTVGIYIPGGSAPLFSTVLMLAVPAALAGCEEIILCTPSDHPAILYTASLTGVTRIFRVGGAQAIAAMAYGTETIPKVYKIFGPGNQYVTNAKLLVAKEGVAIDMPAGPSEVAVWADESAVPAFIAADLLSQAEHGADSQVVLVTTSEQVVSEVMDALQEQLKQLPRQELAEKAIENSKVFLVEKEQDALDIINAYAPEHLILSISNAENIAEKIRNAGSVFIGNYTPESCGDYASGTNHTLPTNGYAKAYSGVSLDSFVKKITFQQITLDGLRELGPTVEAMAEAETLIAHKNAVSIRINTLNS